MANNQGQKAILITGCSSGIGLCAALTLHQRGYRVIATVRRDEDRSPLVDAGIEHVLLLEMRSSSDIERVVSEVVAITNGKLFALFNNAAYGLPGAVEDLTRDALRHQFESNLFGTHELTVKLLPYFLKLDDARIIQNSSVLGFTAMPMRGAYNASKFALEGLTDTLRIELTDTNVKVVLIEPGPITSNFRKNALAAMQEHIDFSKSRHEELYSYALERLNKVGPASKFTLPASAVVDKLIHALESKRPKARYFVTFPTYLMALLNIVLPVRWMDRFLLRVSR
ncbi:SDR family NAD(P)-dependent oxidoreductase [Teredinibacter waterburyi]|jgi:Short-chain dehydrogenases of various substrate specificities|uniref:SDR family NAD(P)-dependent oxidoreductase n=1 Tax=Teredinibacter waterburyi TaxID=1500538 RepID=UPI00165FBFE3|nr:SDR family NAD(P)-dependent oxidoreductase [Teredinibacter waterburyi]